MAARFVACYLILALLMGSTTNQIADPLRLAPVESAFRYDQVNTFVDWAECGEVNAYYVMEDKRVVMCLELLDLPTEGREGFLRFVLAHELAHGVIFQRGVPYTGSQEDAADELAAVVLGALSQAQDVMDAATVFGRMEDGWAVPWDDHTPNSKRAYRMACLAEGAMGGPKATNHCTWLWRRAVRAWNTLLRIEGES